MRLHSISPPRRLAGAVAYLGTAAMLTALSGKHSLALDKRTSSEATGTTFPALLQQVIHTDSASRNEIIEDYIRALQAYGRAVIEDSTIHFIYFGKAKRVSLASDLNGWSPASDTLARVPKTDLFYLSKTLHPAARFEYKLVVDSTWILDPLNKQQAIGGYGPNSEIWMPDYSPSKDIEYREGIPHGRIDSLLITSKHLKRSHPVFVYVPPEYKKLSRKRYPVIFVMDGGEYITLALMPNVLDNLIDDGRIEPVIAVFVDPRTNIKDASTSKRMFDYTLSDTFVNFMVDEVRTRVMRKYRIQKHPGQTGIMGASLGGLIATYAAFTRPDVFGLCAAQSPSYWWKNAAIISLIDSTERRPIRVYIDTGTIRDAQEHASKMYGVLQRRGYDVFYREYPEGHNWVNWRARIDDILEYFWKKK